MILNLKLCLNAQTLKRSNRVNPDLVQGLKDALSEANDNLPSNNKITSIFIKSTTNGVHSPTSNHSNGTAIDISRINGVKMAVSGNEIKTQKLQGAFDNLSNIRENFGPSMKHKFTKETHTWDYNYNISGHKDHIHISIR